VNCAEGAGVRFLPGREFYVVDGAEDRIRLAYSRCSLSELDEAARRLALALQAAR